jgi:hypothetical protein
MTRRISTKLRLDRNRGKIVVSGQSFGNPLVVAHAGCKTNHQPKKGERFTKKALEIAPKAKQTKQQEQDRIDYVHTDGL